VHGTGRPGVDGEKMVTEDNVVQTGSGEMAQVISVKCEAHTIGAEFRAEMSRKRRVVRLAQKLKFQHFHAQNLTTSADAECSFSKYNQTLSPQRLAF